MHNSRCTHLDFLNVTCLRCEEDVDKKIEAICDYQKNFKGEGHHILCENTEMMIFVQISQKQNTVFSVRSNIQRSAASR